MDPNQYNPRPGPQPPGYGRQEPAGFTGPFQYTPPPPQSPESPQSPPPPYEQPAQPPAPPSPYGPPPQPYGQQQPPYPPRPGPGPGPGPGYLPPNPYPGSFDPYGPDPLDNPGGKKHGRLKIIPIVVAIVILIATIAGIVALTGSDKPAPNKQATPKNNGSRPGAAARPTNDLDLSKKIDTVKSVKPQSIQSKINEQVNLSSGFSFAVRNIGAYTSGTATKPATGKKFIILLVVVGNRAQSENISVSYLDFKLRDSSSKLLNGHGATHQILNNLLASPSELKPGQQLEGRLIYEVESAETEWTLVHSETYQKTTDNTTFIVEGRVAVDLKSEGKPAAPPPAAGR